ncbi:MAG: MXAN_5187 C-terminal domain-containing protein [Candidatus Deferrimicrobiaceae bacterium]
MKNVLDRIEADLNELKRQYDLFFQGTRRTEPQEERRILGWMVRRMGQRKLSNTSDQFRFSSLQNRLNTYSSLWTRMIRDLEEGRLTRDSGGKITRATPVGEETIPPDQLDQVLEQLKSARQECGMTTEEKDLNALREMLKARAAEIAGKSGARRVEFRVTIEGGKPKIKAGTR